MKKIPAWSAREVIRFYSQERNQPEQLYPSERALLPLALEGCRNVLDVGCAAGGFWNILTCLKPGIEYTGVDTSRAMVETAARRHPLGRFRLCKGYSLPFEDNSFDLALSTGTLHHNPDYSKMLQEMYRVARTGCLWDLPRLVPESHQLDPEHGYMKLDQEFGGNGADPRNRVPYIIVPPGPLFDLLLTGLKPRPHAITACGYWGTPSPSAVLTVKQVGFCVVYVVKGDRRTRQTKMRLDLPQELLAEVSLHA